MLADLHECSNFEVLGRARAARDTRFPDPWRSSTTSQVVVATLARHTELCSKPRTPPRTGEVIGVGTTQTRRVALRRFTTATRGGTSVGGTPREGAWMVYAAVSPRQWY